MSTPAQVIANQSNAAASSGPRTIAGKAVSSQNALRHGLTSDRVLIPGEDPAEFEAARTALFDQHKPATAGETLYVEDMVVARWKLERSDIVQKSYIKTELERIGGEPTANALTSIMLSDPMRKLQRYESTYRRAYESAWKKLQAIQAERKEEERKLEEGRSRAKWIHKQLARYPNLRNEPNLPLPEATGTATEEEVAAVNMHIQRLHPRILA